MHSGGLARMMNPMFLSGECLMNSRWFLTGMVLAASCSHAADGLSAPRVDNLWPQWQARVQLQTASPLPFGAAKAQEVKGDRKSTRLNSSHVD